MVNRTFKYLSNLYAHFQFWYAKKTLVYDRDFELVGDGDVIEIKVLTGKYIGIVFTIGEIKVMGDDDEAFLNFETSIIANPKKIAIDNKKLVNYVNKVVRIVLSTAIEDLQVKDEQRRVVDIDESYEEREIHEEDSTVSEERVPARKSRKKVVGGDTEVYTEVQQPAKRGSNTAIARKRTKPK